MSSARSGSQSGVPFSMAMIGLGKMGGNMSRRLARAGLRVHGFDADATARRALEDEPGVTVHSSLESAVAGLPTPRAVWLMLPAGTVSEEALESLSHALSPGDVVIDGANARYTDSQQRARRIEQAGLRFIDCGVSGGVHGLANGYCLMLGGQAETIAWLKPVIEALAPAPNRGWVHCGAAGAGHFAKMVHNGIEYGMMQALAEGFALIQRRDDLIADPHAVGEAWREGSVVRSWLLDLTVNALADPAALAAVAAHVSDSGEGRWTVEESIRQGTPIPVISSALMSRFDSQGHADPANRLLAMMRKGFGGHATR